MMNIVFNEISIKTLFYVSGLDITEFYVFAIYTYALARCNRVVEGLSRG